MRVYEKGKKMETFTFGSCITTSCVIFPAWRKVFVCRFAMELNSFMTQILIDRKWEFSLLR
jgi:hypothetical protein